MNLGEDKTDDDFREIDFKDLGEVSWSDVSIFDYGIEYTLSSEGTLLNKFIREHEQGFEDMDREDKEMMDKFPHQHGLMQSRHTEFNRGTKEMLRLIKLLRDKGDKFPFIYEDCLTTK